MPSETALTTEENLETPFGNDAFYWYSVKPWDSLGLAVPNWSNDPLSQNRNIRYLCSIMGRNLQAIMFHDDARLTTPPSINTCTRLHKLYTRARQSISGRAAPEEQFNILRNALEPVIVPVGFLKMNGELVYVNNAFIELFPGKGKRELIELTIYDLFNNEEDVHIALEETM